MRKIGMRVLVTAMIAASIMLASCKYDTEPEDSKKNEETGTKLTIVWDNYAGIQEKMVSKGFSYQLGFMAHRLCQTLLKNCLKSIKKDNLIL